jgi:hypothetical protein
MVSLSNPSSTTLCLSTGSGRTEKMSQRGLASSPYRITYHGATPQERGPLQITNYEFFIWEGSA